MWRTRKPCANIVNGVADRTAEGTKGYDRKTIEATVSVFIDSRIILDSIRFESNSVISAFETPEVQPTLATGVWVQIAISHMCRFGTEQRFVANVARPLSEHAELVGRTRPRLLGLRSAAPAIGSKVGLGHAWLRFRDIYNPG
jgi:hypothetical protein